MTGAAPCTLYSRDQDLARRVAGYLQPLAEVRAVSTQEEALAMANARPGAMILIDLRMRDWRDLSQKLASLEGRLAVALGAPRSDPMAEAEASGHFWMIEELDCERQRLQNVAAAAIRHLDVWLECDHWKGRAMAARQPGSAGSPAERISDRWVRRPLHQDEGLDELLRQWTDEVAEVMGVSRAGLFVKTEQDAVFRLRSGLRCMEETARLRYAEEDELVQWLKTHAHLISSHLLNYIDAPGESALLSGALAVHGAEMIAPLHMRDRLIGWVFIGRRQTGFPWDRQDLERMAGLAEYLSVMLANTLLYDRMMLQNTLLETLMHALPTGVIMAGTDGRIQGFNRMAQDLLGIRPSDVLNQPINVLGSRLEDLLTRTLKEDSILAPEEWADPRSHRLISAQTRRLARDRECLGAVALLQDRTRERQLEDKEEHVERAAFWTELAASMSHEVRNPLVAIKTFAQLLPQRYADADFREEFSRLMNREVDRLAGMVDQINNFANPPGLVFKPLDIRQVVKQGVDLALSRFTKNGIRVETETDESLPFVEGDERSLTECISHLVANSVEALEHAANPLIRIEARVAADDSREPGILLSVTDNGKGIPAAIREKVFSPFCTTKARGMGLGLPMVKRTVMDHNGWVRVQSSDKGACLTMLLPAINHQEKNETSVIP
ncbi:MAG: ATP-binding protein [Lentisphaerota bacterium]